MERLLTNTPSLADLLSVDLLSASIASTSSALDVSSCRKCSEASAAESFIKCSKCLLLIHYNCNEGGVTSYYKKHSRNFKCYLCKASK